MALLGTDGRTPLFAVTSTDTEETREREIVKERKKGSRSVGDSVLRSDSSRRYVMCVARQARLLVR